MAEKARQKTEHPPGGMPHFAPGALGSKSEPILQRSPESDRDRAPRQVPVPEELAMTIAFQRRATLAAAVVSCFAALPCAAADYEVAGGKLSVHGSVFLGTQFRTDSPDADLLPNVNSSLVGIAGTALTASTGRNQDDGNLNFGKGDPVSTILKGYLTLDYKAGNYGAVASAKAWYDFTLSGSTVPWGHFPNGYAADAELSDGGAQPRTKFSGLVADNLYVYGSNDIAGSPLDWTVGYQKLDWGNRYLVLGGLRDLNPIDLPALTRPGTVIRDETRIAIPLIFGRLGVGKSTSLEAFYQVHFQRNAPNQCGTYFSQQDFVAEGCNAVMVGNISDRTALANGNFVKRAETQAPSNSGQAGIAVKHTVADWATDFGFYATQFHSRANYYSVIKSLREAGPPYLPGDPGGLNPKYFTEFPEDIRMVGISVEKKFRGGAVFGELTYRPNQPLQYNAADLIAGFTSLVAPTPLRAAATAVPAGGTFDGYERHKNVQFQLGAVGQIPAVLGAAGMNWGIEGVYKGVPDLPDPALVRFGRQDVFGQGPVNGVCTPPATESQCSTDGYVSEHAFGYRLRAGLRYPDVFQGVDLVPSVLFGHDVSGWSGDLGIQEGRKLAMLSLRANVKGGWTAEVAWWPTWGGTYNNMRDRSTAQASIGYQF